MKKKVGFYFDASHLKDFSIEKFEKGLIGISGTDSSFIRVVIGLSKRADFDIYFFGKEIGEFPDTNFNSVNSFSHAIELAKEKQIDIFIFNLKINNELDDILALAQKIELNLVVWAQNPIPTPTLDRLNANTAVLKIVFVEDYDLSHIRHKKGFYKGVVIPNGIEKEVYVRGEIKIPDNLNVFYLGSLTPSKGFHHIAKAWPKILKKVPNAKLFIIGSGKLYNNHANLGPLGIANEEYERELMPFIGKNKQELKKNNVECLGLLNRNEVIDLIYNSKVGCMNANTFGSLESCSVTSLEVQLCGVPIIAGKAGGNLNTIINNKTGILIKDQENELPEAIIRLLTNDQLNLEMRKAAREYILRKYELRIVIDEWVAFLNKLMQGQPFPILPVTPELASNKLYAKEFIRLVNKVLGK